jgi:hypothetical protein
MRRLAVIGGLAVAAVIALAGPASAKGPGDLARMPVSGSATIDGPGLARPLSLSWHGDCLEYCMELRRPNPFVDLVTGAGLFGFRGDVIRDSPPQGDLGPGYDVVFSVTYRSGRSDRVTAELYPYGPGDLPPYITVEPWFRIAAGQRFLHEPLAAGWWPSSPSLLGELRDLGLPSRRALTRKSTAGIGAAGIAAAAAFAALLLAGAVAGRPRRRRSRP